MASGTVRRLLALERCLVGCLLLGAPGKLTRAVAAGDPQPPAGIVRVLGARLLAQGLIQFLRPRRQIVLTGIAVDGLHAASMIPIIALVPGYRRTAAASAAEAAVSAMASASTLGTRP